MSSDRSSDLMVLAVQGKRFSKD